jgi:hypothetical protein
MSLVTPIVEESNLAGDTRTSSFWIQYVRFYPGSIPIQTGGGCARLYDTGPLRGQSEIIRLVARRWTRLDLGERSRRVLRALEEMRPFVELTDEAIL